MPEERDDYDTVEERDEANGYNDDQNGFVSVPEPPDPADEDTYQGERLNGPQFVSGIRSVPIYGDAMAFGDIADLDAITNYEPATATEAMINQQQGRRRRYQFQWNHDTRIQPLRTEDHQVVTILEPDRARAYCAHRDCDWSTQARLDDMGEVWQRATTHYYQEQHNAENAEEPQDVF